MFDLSFYELLVFGIIALIVLGPEKLPQAVRTLGTYYAKFRRTVTTLKNEMEAELDLAETRQQMQKELAQIRQTEAQMKQQMDQLRGSMQQFEHQQSSQLKKTMSASADSLSPADSPIDSPAENLADSRTQNLADNLTDSRAKNLADSHSDNSAALSYGSSEDGLENADKHIDNGFGDTATSTTGAYSAMSPTEHTTTPQLTRPWENMWFRLGDYDRKRRLPPAPLLPNYHADTLLYNMNHAVINPLHHNATHKDG